MFFPKVLLMGAVCAAGLAAAALPLPSTIVIPAQATPAERYAAEELAAHLEAVYGGAFPVVDDRRNAEPCISVGLTRQLAQRPELPPPGELAPEELVVATLDGDIYLYGGVRRGPLYAVYDFLETECGVLWLTPDYTWIPAGRERQVAVTFRRSKPAFPDMRDPYGFFSHDWKWCLRNRVTGPRTPIPPELGGTIQYPAGLFAHTYCRAVPPSEFDAHPEYFMLDAEGSRNPLQLCPSQPAVRERMADLVGWGLHQAEAPERPVFISVSQNDAALTCRCPDCQRLTEAEGTEAAPNLMLVNRIAEEFRESHPELVVSFLAYQRTLVPPATLKAAPNTVAWLCTDINFNREYIPIRLHPDFPGWLEGWKACVPRLHIWDYQVNFSNYFEYRPSFYAIADNLRYFRDNGVSGVFSQQAYSSVGPERQGMRSWVFARLLWNPDLEVEALMHQYVEGMFGPAAPPVWRFYDHIYRYGAAGRRIPPEEYPDLVKLGRECFDEAFALAGGDRELVRRLELESFPILVSEFNQLAASADPADPAQMENRRRALERLAAVATDHGVANYSEGTRFEVWLEQQRTPPSPQVTEVVDGAALTRLAGGWQILYVLDEAMTAYWDGLPTPETLPDGWERIRSDIGLGWAGQGRDGFLGRAIYHNTVVLPETLEYEHYYLFFGALDTGGAAYVNGGLAGEHSSRSTGLTPKELWDRSFAFEVTDLVRQGRNTVTVDCFEAGNLGGLYMPVWLVGSDRELDADEIRRLTRTVNPFTGV